MTRAEFWNKNFDQPNSKYILFLNPNVILSVNAVNKMLQIMESDELTGAVGTYMNYSLHSNQLAKLNYKTYAEMIPIVEKFEAEHTPRLHMYLEGECLLVRKSVLNKIKFINGEIVNSKLTKKLNEGVSLSFNVWKAGFTVKLAPTFVHWNHMLEKFPQDIHVDDQILTDELGFRLIYSTTVRTTLLSMIPEFKDDLQILEVGCAAGGTLLEIKNRNPNIRLYGIEINANSAKISSCFGKIENVDVEKFSPVEWNNKFDYIICGDVIEHLIDPWTAVKNLREMLKPDGHMLISLPNVMHIEVINELLHGRWNYADYGILDRTHLRFWTFDNINQMLLDSRLKGNVIPKSISVSEENKKLAKELSIRFDVPEYNYTTFQWLINVYKY